MRPALCMGLRFVLCMRLILRRIVAPIVDMSSIGGVRVRSIQVVRVRRSIRPSASAVR